jgi:hypothetical protein
MAIVLRVLSEDDYIQLKPDTIREYPQTPSESTQSTHTEIGAGIGEFVLSKEAANINNWISFEDRFQWKRTKKDQKLKRNT